MAVHAERRTSADVSAEIVLAAVMETSDDAIIPVSNGYGVTAWGPTAERLFGVTHAEAIGQPIDQMFSPHVRAGLRSVVARALSGERIIHFETELLRADGLPVPLWVSICPLVDADGDPWGVVAIARDVTEQHLAQASLAEVEGRLEEAEALSHVGSWLWDLRTGSVQWSTEFYRIHGVDPFDFDGTLTSHLNSVHPDDRGEMHLRMEDSVASGRPFECECRILRSDGTLRLLKVRAHPSVGSDGSVVGLRGIGQDVTEPTGPSSVVGDQVSHPGHDVPLGGD